MTFGPAVLACVVAIGPDDFVVGMMAAEPMIDAEAPPVVPEPATPADEPAPVKRPTMLLWTDAVSGDPVAWTARVRRVQAELEALGIETVLFVPAPGQGAANDVAVEMQAQGATIALWIAADRDRAEVWRLESHRLAHVAIVAGEAAEDEGTFAVRCAEVAHALSTEVAIVPEPEPPPVVAPIEPTRVVGPRWDVRAGASVGGASRDVGVVLGPIVGGGVRLGARRRLGLDAELGVTALRGRISGTAGTARIGWFTARAHVGVWPVPRARVSPMFGVGGGVLMAWTRGDGVAPFRGRSDLTSVAIASVAIDVAIRLSRRVRLRLGTRVGVAVPPLSIDTGGREHRTALPVGEAILAVDVTGEGRTR